MPGVPALSCAALTLGMCTQGSVNHWNCCCCCCLVLIPPAVQQVGGCSARGSVGDSSEQIWFVPFSGWDAIANSELLFYGEMLPGFPLLCLAAPSQRKVVWGCARKGSVCKAAPGLCCSPSWAQVQPVCGTWGSLNTQNVFISCCTNCPSVSGCPFLAWILEHFFPCFNPFSLLSEPSLQVERGRRTNEEVESYSGRKRERNCKPSKTVTGKVYTLSWGVCIYMYKVYICECISLYIIYLYLYMSIYCLFSFNRMCKKKMNLSKLKYRN